MKRKFHPLYLNSFFIVSYFLPSGRCSVLPSGGETTHYFQTDKIISQSVSQSTGSPSRERRRRRKKPVTYLVLRVETLIDVLKNKVKNSSVSQCGCRAMPRPHPGAVKRRFNTPNKSGAKRFSPYKAKAGGRSSPRGKSGASGSSNAVSSSSSSSSSSTSALEAPPPPGATNIRVAVRVRPENDQEMTGSYRQENIPPSRIQEHTLFGEGSSSTHQDTQIERLPHCSCRAFHVGFDSSFGLVFIQFTAQWFGRRQYFFRISVLTRLLVLV